MTVSEAIALLNQTSQSIAAWVQAIAAVAAAYIAWLLYKKK